MSDQWVPWVRGLKQQKDSSALTLPAVLSLHSLARISVHEARQYLEQRPQRQGANWGEMGDLQIAQLSSEAEEWVHWERRRQAERSDQHQERLKHIQRIQPELKRLLPGCPEHPKHPQMRRLIDQRLHQMEEGGGTEGQRQQQKQTLTHARSNLDLIIGWQGGQKEGSEEDKEQERRVEGLLERPSMRVGKQDSLRFRVGQLGERQQQLWERGRKKVDRLFQYYCRQSREVPQTFGNYSRAATLMDLRLFLKYSKDLHFQEINKFFYGPANLTVLFRSHAQAGQQLTGDHFWLIHCHVFQLARPELTADALLEIPDYQLSLRLEQLEHEVSQLQALIRAVAPPSQSKKVQAFSLKNSSASPRSRDSSPAPRIPASRGLFPSSSTLSLPRQESGTCELPRGGPNPEQYQLHRRKEGAEGGRRKEGTEGGRRAERANLPVSLPRILKLSQKEIAGQGIYSSLKHFAPYEYATQEPKLRSIIGLSSLEEPQELRAFWRGEGRGEAQRKAEAAAVRQERRKRARRQHREAQDKCRRYRPHDVEPYMRF